jgi:hypothetical protein
MEVLDPRHVEMVIGVQVCGGENLGAGKRGIGIRCKGLREVAFDLINLLDIAPDHYAMIWVLNGS